MFFNSWLLSKFNVVSVIKQSPSVNMEKGILAFLVSGVSNVERAFNSIKFTKPASQM